MTTDKPRGISRRQFLIAGLCAGGAALVGASVLKFGSGGAANSIAVFRNPAYNLRQDSDGAVLVCHTAKGETIAFRMDEPAALFWEQVPTAEAFGTDGKRVTVDQVLAAIAPHFKGKAEPEWQHDARLFVQEALQQGVLLTEKDKVKIAYTPPIKGA